MNALVKRAQEIIESNNPAKYYDIYKKHEVGYWSRIPEMIVDYNEVRFVDNVLDVGAAYGTLLMFTHLNVPHCNLYAIDNVPYMSFRTEFLAPEIVTSPRSGVPPITRKRS